MSATILIVDDEEHARSHIESFLTPRGYETIGAATLEEARENLSQGKADIIKASMMIAASDGDIDPSEVRMVEQFGKALDMRPAEVRTIIESVKV